jgi:hypothetical protein
MGVDGMADGIAGKILPGSRSHKLLFPLIYNANFVGPRLAFC